MAYFLSFIPMFSLRAMFSALITLVVVFGVAIGIQKNCTEIQCAHNPHEFHHACDGVNVQFVQSLALELRKCEHASPSSSIIFTLPKWIETVAFSGKVRREAVNGRIPFIANHIASTVLQT